MANENEGVRDLPSQNTLIGGLLIVSAWNSGRAARPLSPHAGSLESPCEEVGPPWSGSLSPQKLVMAAMNEPE